LKVHFFHLKHPLWVIQILVGNHSLMSFINWWSIGVVVWEDVRLHLGQMYHNSPGSLFRV
ncbi:MAG: hypothetical protein ACXVHW_06545, partial [Methanobacterium sp.]